MAQFHLLSSRLGDITRYGGGLHVSAGVGIGHAIRKPQIAVGPLYAAKTIDLCVPTIRFCCSGTDFNKHMQYEETVMVDQAATFTASRVVATPAPGAPPQTPAPAAPPTIVQLPKGHESEVGQTGRAP